MNDIALQDRKVLLEISDLRVHFDIKDGKQWFWQPKKSLKAVDGVSLRLYEGETLGVVGESGCGKSTLARAIIGLVNAKGGRVTWLGRDLLGQDDKAWRDARTDIQMIFQDPYASLNPRMKVNDIIAEGIDINKLANDEAQRTAKVNELLQVVGLDPSHGTRYPHEFSGGQRQRIGIARALAVDPRFIICDEPISALDVSIQAQVVNLLQDLQKNVGLTYLFIAHDLSMVKHISDRIGVMHSGKLLEMGSSEDVYSFGVHPYTESLLSAIPLPDPEYERNRKRIIYQAPAADNKERKLREITPEHYVYCSEDEVMIYRQKIEAKKAAAQESL